MSEQAVSNADVEAKPSTEEGAAQEDDLDALLNEFDSTTETSNEPDQNTEQQGLSDEDRQLLQSFRQEQESKAVDDTIKSIKEHMPEDIGLSDKAFKRVVLGMASDDARIAEAYALRNTSPDAWAAVQKSIAKEIAKDYGNRPDSTATDTHNAIAAAVRSASTSSPSNETITEKDMNNMSDADFKKMTQAALAS